MNIKTLRYRITRAWAALLGRDIGHAVLTVKRDMIEELTIDGAEGTPMGKVWHFDTELFLDGLDIDLHFHLVQPSPGPDHPEHAYHDPHQVYRLKAGDRFQLDISHHQLPGDTELLDWLSEQVEGAHVSSCFELDGGVHLTIERPSMSGFAIRHANDLRHAIRQCMVKLPADDFGVLSITPQPDPKA